MRADRHDHQRRQVRLDDRAIAGQRIRGRARRARDDDAIAIVGIDVGAIDPCLEVERAPGVVLLHDHIVEREGLRHRAACAVQPRGEQGAPVGLELTGERRVDRLQHVLGHDIGQEPEAAAVHADQRHLVPRHQARPVEQRPIAADRDHEVRPLAHGVLRHARHRGVGRELRILAHQHLHAAALEVWQQRADALRDARIRESADQGTGAHRKAHLPAALRSVLALVRRAFVTRWVRPEPMPPVTHLKASGGPAGVRCLTVSRRES